MRVSGKHNDLDNVGPSLRHHTFFEMLGNFSFGDYFKQRGDPVRVGVADEGVEPAGRTGCIPTIFKGDAGIPRDDEAHAIWTQFVPARRITELGLAENFWQMGETGPCGRCSEIHYFRGDEFPCDEERQRRQVPRPRLQLRSLRRGLEQRVHGVRPPGRRHAESAARPVDRHRHGPRADHRGDSGQAVELRHRSVHADPRRHRRAGRAAATARASTTRPTSRCGSSPITCAR